MAWSLCYTSLVHLRKLSFLLLIGLKKGQVIVKIPTSLFHRLLIFWVVYVGYQVSSENLFR